MKKWLVVLTIVSIFMGSQKVVKAVAVTGACEWCGATCQRTTVGQMCMDVAPPTGKICVEENGVCVALSTIALPTVPEEKAVGGEAYLSVWPVNSVDESGLGYDRVDLVMHSNTMVQGADIWLSYDPEIWQLMKVEPLSQDGDKFVYSFNKDMVKIDNKKGIVSVQLNGTLLSTLSQAQVSTTYKQSLLRFSFKPIKSGTHLIDIICQNGVNTDTNIFDKNVNDIINCTKNIPLSKQVILPVVTVVPELTPVVTASPSVTPGVFYATNSVILKADDFVIKANGKEFRPKGKVVSVHSDPPEFGENQKTTLELIWDDGGVEMRTFLYFSYVKSTNVWTLDETRTYNGKTPGDWLFYYSNTPISMNMFQQPYKKTLDLTSNNGLGRLTIKNMELSLNFVLSNGCVNNNGDANGDEKADLVDFGIWKAEYLATIKTVQSKADFNCDGKVDLVDFGIWKSEYLKN